MGTMRMNAINAVEGEMPVNGAKPRCRSCVSDGAVKAPPEDAGRRYVKVSETEAEIEKLIEELKEEDPEFEVPEGVWAY
jgi:hypothetical protein